MTAESVISEGNSDAPAAAAPPSDDRIARTHLIVSLVFLAVALVMGSLAALQLVLPEFLGGVALASYGRLWPMATSAFLYGWLTIALLGAVYFILPRVSAVPLRSSATAGFSLTLITVGVALGLAGIGAGSSEGRPYLEMPLFADAVVFFGLLIAAWVATRTVAQSKDALGPVQWYLLAATWWLVLSYLAGNLPGIPGFNGAIQSAFYRAGITGLWFMAAGVGIAYYLIPKLAGRDPIEPSPLAALGFWSLALVWAGTGARDFIYGPGADWLESIGVAFAIALLVPVAVIFADFALGMRGRWDDVTDRVTLRFLVAGAWLFALVPLHNLLQTLRTSSAILQFTEWVTAFDYLAFYGAVTMWLFAFVYHAVGRRADGGLARPNMALWHFRYSLLGLGVALLAMWTAGLLAGFTWAAGVNSGLYDNFAEGFFNTVVPLGPYYAVRAVGVMVFALAQLLFLAAIVGTGRGGHQEKSSSLPPLEAEAFDLQFEEQTKVVSWGRLRFGAIALFAGVALLAWLLPSLDPANSDDTRLAETSRRYPEGSAAAAGRQIYLEEGCWYCHTQEVRAIVTDVGLGAVSEAGDYFYEDPILLGTHRLGPDLMHAGSREPTNSFGWVVAFLEDPRQIRPWSTMPSYEYLSDAELDVLAEYIVGLK